MQKVFLLDGLDCAHCAAKIETAVSKLEGVQSVSVSFLTQKLVMEVTEAAAADIEKEVRRLVKKHLSDVTVQAL